MLAPEMSARDQAVVPVPALHAALNGDRVHPRAPRTPDALARDALAAVEAGAVSLHLHPYDEAGRQTLEGVPCAARFARCALRAPAYRSR